MPQQTVVREHDWEVLPYVTNEFLRARDIASAMFGKPVQEVLDSGESYEVSRRLQRLYSHGYVAKDYYGNTKLVTYALTDTGREYLRDEKFGHLLKQAA